MGKAFVYTEVQVSVPFEHVPWQEMNPVLRRQPGLVNKTWLSGHGNGSIGGLYEFDSVENAKRFALDYFPTEARKLDAPFTVQVFDGGPTEAASRDMGSVHYR